MDRKNYRAVWRVLFATICFVAFGCSISFGQESEQPIRLPEDSLPAEVDLNYVPHGFKSRPEVPADNPLTIEKVRLGRKLFFDPVLSNDGTVACASCHDPKHGFATPDPVALGINRSKGTLNAPSLINRAYGKVFFWDGRADSLEQQVFGPLTSETELGGDVDGVIRRLTAHEEYPQLFAAAFPEENDAGPNPPPEIISTQNIARAIASFERTLLAGNSEVDRFHASEYVALNAAARTGMWIFESSGGCWKCHAGENFSDELFHNTGVGFGKEGRDDGRMKTTFRLEDQHHFKTPSLRGVDLTAPYMHDGSMATLEEVVEFYSKGGSREDAGLDPLLKPLELSADEKNALVEYLKALSRHDFIVPAKPDDSEK